jgi:hypothetical protein
MLREHLVAIEVEVGTERSARNHARQPVDVVGPHFVVGNPINRRPDRKGFVGFDEGAGEGIGYEHGAMKTIAVNELKMEFSTGLDSVRRDADFFLGLTHGAIVWFLAGFDAAAGGVDFTRAETAFFADEEDLGILHNETQGGPLARLPLVPEIVHGRRRLGQEADQQLRVESENEDQQRAQPNSQLRGGRNSDRAATFGGGLPIHGTDHLEVVVKATGYRNDTDENKQVKLLIHCSFEDEELTEEADCERNTR